MAKSIRSLIAGNWKMNGFKSVGSREVRKLARQLAKNPGTGCDVLICPPATLLAPLVEVLKGSRIAIGGQDCHSNEAGAHTGDVSAAMLKDLGCAYVIVGHSERRENHKESNKLVRAKAKAAHKFGLRAIICVGETAVDRKRGKTLEVVGKQLSASLPRDCNSRNTVIAYEPIWAIGTGLIPSLEEIDNIHSFIKNEIRNFENYKILYGGSVNSDNASQIMALKNVDGVLVGGASLDALKYKKIMDS